jgi:hypothetical protein
MSKQETKTMDVFLHKSVQYGSESIMKQEDMTEFGYVLLGKGTTTITMLDHSEVVAKEVESLKAAKQLMNADHQVKLEKIDEKIQSLLAISHEGE